MIKPDTADIAGEILRASSVGAASSCSGVGDFTTCGTKMVSGKVGWNSRRRAIAECYGSDAYIACEPNITLDDTGAGGRQCEIQKRYTNTVINGSKLPAL
jgi:hypothetical protein